MARNKVEIVNDSTTTVLLDVSGTTATPETVLTGYTFTQADGTQATGTMEQIGLNIHYGDTAPEDTSMLWVNGGEASRVYVQGNLPVGIGSVEKLDETLPVKCRYAATASVGENIYIFGGTDTTNSSDSEKLNKIQIFNTSTKTARTASATLPAAVTGATAAAVGTNIYVFGGAWSNKVCVFDTVNETLTTLSVTIPNYNGAIVGAYMTAVAVGTKVYLFGGENRWNQYVPNVRIFDTATNSFTESTATTENHDEDIGAVAIGNDIWLFGGGDNNTISIFDTTSQTLTKISQTLSVNMNSFGCVAVGTDVYLIGGKQYYSTYLSTIYRFDTKLRILSRLELLLPVATVGASVALVESTIYMLGGSVSTYLDTANIYQLPVVGTVNQNNVLIKTDISDNDNWVLISSDAVKVSVTVKNIYRGDSNNVAQPETAYLYNGTEWVEV